MTTKTRKQHLVILRDGEGRPLDSIERKTRKAADQLAAELRAYGRRANVVSK